MSDHEGTAALVVGGSNGIGRATVRQLAAEGAQVGVVAHDADGVAAVVAEVEAAGGRAVPYVLDVRDTAALGRAVADFAARAGRIDTLVCSAGIQRYGTVTETSDEVWADVFAVNVTSVFVAVRECMPHLRGSGRGAVVVVSSVQGVATQPGVVAYTTSKGALNAFVRAVAVDEAAAGVRINAVLPGSVDTPMLRASARSFARPGQSTDDVVAEWGTTHPRNVVGRPEEVADVVCFLASPRAANVTGAEVRVDGGLLAKLPVALPDPED